MNKKRFSVYEHSLVNDKGIFITRYLIVIKEDRKIIGWTNFHKYISENVKDLRPIQRNYKNRCIYICKFLNYCFFEKQCIKKISDLTIPMVEDFFYDYSLQTNRVIRDTTVKTVLDYISDFLCELAKKKVVKFKESDIYENKDIYIKKQHKFISKRVPKFKVFYSNKKGYEIFRDIPIGAFLIIADVISKKHIDILMLVILSAFAGLRPSESCNVITEDSPLGKGILIDYLDGYIQCITIDISEERQLRKDLKKVGGIKKERYQCVFTPFMDAFYECYKLYLEKNKCKRDVNYMPLTPDSRGNAMTYDVYRKRFDQAINDAIPVMLASDDPEVVFYGNKLLSRKIAPHIFRHFFSMMLVLAGCTIDEIMFWRGDASTESAATYIAHKSEIEKKFNKVKGQIFKFDLCKAEEMYGKNRHK